MRCGGTGVYLNDRAAGTGALSRHKTSVRTGFIPRSPLGTRRMWCAVCDRTAANARTGSKAFLPRCGEGDNSGAESLFALARILYDNALKTDFDVEKMNIGDFIEVEGELQKNPLIDCMDKFADVFRMAEIFSGEPQLGNKTQAKAQKKQEQEVVKQIQSFSGELKHSGTIDFVLSDAKGTVVLSLQEQYLSNDNISEILGVRFKVLGKIIAICKDDSENIDLLRKTTLSILPEEILNTMFVGFQDENLRQCNLPELKTKISGPALIVIPIAIYA